MQLTFPSLLDDAYRQAVSCSAELTPCYLDDRSLRPRFSQVEPDDQIGSLKLNLLPLHNMHEDDRQAEKDSVTRLVMGFFGPIRSRHTPNSSYKKHDLSYK